MKTYTYSNAISHIESLLTQLDEVAKFGQAATWFATEQYAACLKNKTDKNDTQRKQNIKQVIEFIQTVNINHRHVSGLDVNASLFEKTRKTFYTLFHIFYTFEYTTNPYETIDVNELLHHYFFDLDSYIDLLNQTFDNMKMLLIQCDTSGNVSPDIVTKNIQHEANKFYRTFDEKFGSSIIAKRVLNVERNGLFKKIGA